MSERKAVIKYIKKLMAAVDEHGYTKGYQYHGHLESDLDKLLELEGEQYAKDANLDYITENQFNGQV